MYQAFQILLKRVPLFWRNVGVVMLGTVLAQAIPFMALPYFTRVLPPDVLGAYFLWFSVAIVLGTVVSLSLEHAIFLARDRVAVDSLVRTVVIVAAVLSALAYGITFVAERAFSTPFIDPSVCKFAWGWSVFAFFYAVSQTVLAVYIYRSDFVNSSAVRFALASSVGIAQLVGVALGLGLQGLIYGHVFAFGTATLLMMWRLSAWPFNLSRSQFWSVAKNLRENYRFIVFSTPTVVLNTAAAQLPFLILSARYGNETIAYYGLAQRLLIVPDGLLSVSILTVFKDEAGAEIRSTGACLKAYRHAFKSLLLVAIIPYLGVFLFAKPAFVLVFGQDWAEAGVIAQYLTPMLFVGFVSGPLSYTLTLTHKQSWFLVTQSGLFAVTLIAFGMASSVRTAIIWYSIGRVLLYLIEIGISYVAARGDRVDHSLIGDGTTVGLAEGAAQGISQNTSIINAD